MDTVEHYVNPTDRHNSENQAKIYIAMFEFANNLLKEYTTNGRIFISCLHQVKNLDFKRKINAHIMNRTISGKQRISIPPFSANDYCCLFKCLINM